MKRQTPQALGGQDMPCAQHTPTLLLHRLGRSSKAATSKCSRKRLSRSTGEQVGPLSEGMNGYPFIQETTQDARLSKQGAAEAQMWWNHNRQGELRGGHLSGNKCLYPVYIEFEITVGLPRAMSR